MKYKHLTVEEREELEQRLRDKESLRSIASVLGRSHSSLVRERARNQTPVQERYTPRVAEARAQEQRKSRGRIERLKTAEVREYVVLHLKQGWSPEQIAGCIETDIGETISHEAVYQYVYAQVYRNGYGLLRPGAEDLRPYLPRRHKRRAKRGGRKGGRVLRPAGPSIETRPSIVSRRTRLGDWEGDSIESRAHGPGLNSLVDRKSGLLLLSKLESKSARATRSVVARRLKDMEAWTVTLDNGPENRMWAEMERETGAKIFFAHPYASFERGTNENTNGLVRRYFPKGTDFASVSEEEVARVEYALNTRPRKRLKWKTPLEVWGGALQG